jgi:glutamate-1-semialdehyde 2,1-aminomutase
MKIHAIVQARLGSKRFPKKVLQSLGNYAVIELLLNRLSKSKLINKIIIATTVNEEDKELINFSNKLGYDAYPGSIDDVLDRYYKIAIIEQSDIIVRITADCPFIDPNLVDKVIEKLINTNSDYSSNTQPPTYPDGLDVEAFTMEALKQVWTNSTSKHDREHVTPYLYNNKNLFKVVTFKNSVNFSNIRLTIDEKVDLIVMQRLFKELDENIYFNWEEVTNLFKNKPELFMENNQIKRNEGGSLGNGQKLWKRAKTVIPGGNMLLSKRSEMFLPDYWPSYFSKAKGIHVWDIDDNKYMDMSIMGIGTNTLGYGNEEVDTVVKDVIKTGNMSTFNCPEEVYLAEKLIELHPWANMVKYTRSGGEANAVALRIARAASGRDGVAICGYHGWHDWYLAANLGSNKELSGHLLPGLEPNGVPQALLNTTHTFNYNDLEALQKIIDVNSIGVIFMEVMRNFEPENDFLLKVRELATKYNIVLVFDECTSGFRETYGGLHLKYGVEPDIAMFGKALGNGYAINAIIGRRDVMEYAQSTFISSTFWTERIGPAAALKTLEVMQKIKSWEIITKIGLDVASNWKEIANLNNIEISISGLAALSSFSFKSSNALEFKTYMTQEMLKKGILASNSFYACTEHKTEYLELYFNELNKIFKFISTHQENITEYINGSICHSGFKRIN